MLMVPFEMKLQIFQLAGSAASGFHENKIDGAYHTGKTGQMIPSQRLLFKKDRSENGKHQKRDYFLDHLQLHE